MYRIFFILFLTIFSLTANGAQKKLLLITGCHASGTHYISKVLQNCGLDVRHERMGKDGCVGWFMVKPSLARKILVGSHDDFLHVFHQIRHPPKGNHINFKDSPQKLFEVYTRENRGN